MAKSVSSNGYTLVTEARGTIVFHTCMEEEPKKCAEFCKDLSAVVTCAPLNIKEAVMSDCTSQFEEEILETWKVFCSKINEKSISLDCELLSRSFLCWLFLPLCRMWLAKGKAITQQLETILHSGKRILISRNVLMLQSFDKLLRVLIGYGEDCINALAQTASFSYKLSILLLLALINAELLALDDVKKFLAEAEKIPSSFEEKDAIFQTYCKLVDSFFQRKPPDVENAVFFAEKTVCFLKEIKQCHPKKEIKLMKLLAIAKATQNECDQALHYIAQAEKLEPSFELLLTRFRILICSQTTGSLDWALMAATIEEIISNSTFSIDFGLAVIKRLIQDSNEAVGELFLKLMWESLGRHLQLNADALPLFWFQFRRCIVKGEVTEAKRIFTIFDKAPSLIEKLPAKMIDSICSTLNKYAISFVKTKQMEKALAYYELCNNLLSFAPPAVKDSTPEGNIKNVPSVAQIKRSLALCQFELGHFEECKQTLKEAQGLEDSPWIHFVWFYIAVELSSSNEGGGDGFDEPAVDHLQKIFSSSHTDAPGLLDLSATVAMKAHRKSLAVTALEYRLSILFDANDDDALQKMATNLLSAIKALIRLRSRDVQNDLKPEDTDLAENLLKETVVYSVYMARAYKLLSLLDSNEVSVIENIKWFSEVCWHISNRMNGAVIKIERAPLILAESCLSKQAKSALFSLYRCSADFMKLLFPATSSPCDVLLQKYCLGLSLSIVAGIHYLRLLEWTDPERVRFASEISKCIIDCQQTIKAITSSDEYVTISCGSLSLPHSLPVFEFEVRLNLADLDAVDSIVDSIVQEANAELGKKIASSDYTASQCIDYAVTSCETFISLAGIAQSFAEKTSSDKSFYLVLRNLIHAVSMHYEAEKIASTENLDLDKSLSANLASRVRIAFQTCRKFDREKSLSPDFYLYKLLDHMVHAERSGFLWNMIPNSEAEWLISCCWNQALERRIQPKDGQQTNVWLSLSMAAAARLADKKMLSLLQEKVRAIEKWESVTLGDRN